MSILATCTSALDQYGRHCLPPTGMNLAMFVVAGVAAMVVGLVLLAWRRP
jgi:hypothetical protein